MSAVEEMKDINTYCPHKADIDGFCKKCAIYLCKKCQVQDHFDHIIDVQGLDYVVTEAIQEYTKMNSALDKHLLTSSSSIKDGAIDETLLLIEKKISEDYDKLLKDIKSIEDEQAAIVRGSSLLAKLHKEKEGLEGEDLKALTEFDKKLGSTISQLLLALENEKYEAVAPLLTEGNKEQLLKEAQQHETYYAKQKNFMKQLEVLRGVKPKIAYNSKTIDDLVQVKGVFEEVVKLLLFDFKSDAVYVHLPKLKTVKKNEVKGINRKTAQVAVEDDSLFICGGIRKPKTYLGNSCLYTEADNKVVTKAYMQEERAYHGIVNRKDTEIYVAGGVNSTGLLSSAEVYDIKANVWKMLPKMTESKKNIALCLCGDKYLYSIGGWDKKELSTIEMLNIGESKGWERKNVQGAMELQKSGAVQTADNQILIFGGKSGGKKIASCWVYDVTNGNIIPKAMLMTPSCFNRSDNRKLEGMVYATGNIKSVTHVYDITSNQWSAITDKEYVLKYNWDLR